MKVREVEFQNGKSLIIYLTRREGRDENIIFLIGRYKELYKKVSVFVSGEEGIEDILKGILTQGGQLQ